MENLENSEVEGKLDSIKEAGSRCLFEWIQKVYYVYLLTSTRVTGSVVSTLEP